MYSSRVLNCSFGVLVAEIVAHNTVGSYKTRPQRELQHSDQDDCSMVHSPSLTIRSLVSSERSGKWNGSIRSAARNSRSLASASSCGLPFEMELQPRNLPVRPPEMQTLSPHSVVKVTGTYHPAIRHRLPTTASRPLEHSASTPPPHLSRFSPDLCAFVAPGYSTTSAISG